MWKSNSLMLFGILGLSCATTAQGNGCSASQPSISAPRGNSWKAISVDESAEITSWLQTRLSLTGDSGSSQDSFVKQISALHSNKTDVIQYLDGYADAPARFARATVVIGATNSTDLYWQEYMVGPLPVTNSTVATPLTYPFTNQEPGKTKVHPIYSVNDGASFTLQLNTNIEDITKALWNSTLVEGAIGLRFGVSYTNDEGRIISWAGFFANPIGLVSSPTILPLGVSIQFDLTGRNWEDWKTIGWYSRGEYYNSTEAFRETISAPDFVKPPPNENGNWTSTDKQGDPLPLDDLPPPISVAQGSQRFKIDTVEDYVSWMDFSFYFAVSHDLGLSLHDVKFKGTRLMYELSLQEAITTYAGSDPYAAQSTYLDTGTGFGTVLQPLLKGYDCPYHATYLNATFAEGNSTRTQAGAICIFEHDASYPIRRHSFSPSAPFTSVAKNIVFTMRTISTIGNYDFLIEYNFFYDGSIQVSARASGYISAAYWEGKSEYGFHIHDHLSGSLHDHVLTFKADLDILGTKNSMQKVDFVPTSTTYPWSQGRVYNTFKVSKSIESNEISVKWPFNDGTIYAIVNKDKPNRFGEYPGFRIKRSAGTSHLTTLNSTAAGNAAAYATHDFYVTQQKDTEPRATDPFNQFAVEDPLVDFANFLDGESIEQEDLVVWFNLGMHHIPHTGDLPNTIYEAAHSAMRFEPLNYLEGDPSVASNQQVRLDLGEDGSITSVEEFGKKPGLCDAQKLG